MKFVALDLSVRSTGFAWWKEGLGSAVTLLSLLAFYLVYGYLLRNHIGGWVFIAFASPGFLFLLHWLLSAAGEKEAAALGTR